MFEKLREIIAEQLNVNEDEIRADCGNGEKRTDL